jgi:hypothetical protein
MARCSAAGCAVASAISGWYAVRLSPMNYGTAAVNTCASQNVFINSVSAPAELVGTGTVFTSLLVKRLQRLFGSHADRCDHVVGVVRLHDYIGKVFRQEAIPYRFPTGVS